MIEFDGVSVTYPGAARPVLREVDLLVPEGELCLVTGRTGAGKSTLLRAVNGMVPHFTGGTLRGRVRVAGRDTREHRPRDLADVVGVVGQDPLAGFVADVVEDELAYGMEWLGLRPDVMRRRVEETLDLLGLADLRRRRLGSLSGGQRQRVAIGAALAIAPRVLVLDEPTSALDPQGAEDVLATLQRLVHDLGLTVLLSEHRLERVVQYAERIVHLAGDGSAQCGQPAEILAVSPVAPPVVELGRLLAWSPLPLTVRDARRAAVGLRARLRAHPVVRMVPQAVEPDGPSDGLLPGWAPGQRAPDGQAQKGQAPAWPAERTRRAPAPTAVGCALLIDGLAARYGQVHALRGVDLAVAPSEVVAVMGRNGAGKSTLLGCIVGLVEPTAGRVDLDGVDPLRAKPAAVRRRAGLVPAQPSDLLYASTIARECAQADMDADVPAGATWALFRRLAGEADPELHPRDLSEGNRLALALAVVLVARPPVVLLDEPTRGLDYPGKRRLVEILSDLALAGHAIILATHDVELVAEAATRVVVLADGEVVADGPAASVLLASAQFAPQVAKVLAPESWLTVGEVAAALESA